MKKLLLLTSLIIVFATAATYGQAVTPQATGSNYSIQVANVYFEVNPAFGGRIVSFKLNNKEILYLVTGEGNYGSTFWPAPQSTWNWPPITELDSKPYTGGIVGNSINIVSSLSSKLSLKFRKVFTADLADTSISIDYYIINGGTQARSIAPWEITRVAVTKGGMIFFPDSGKYTGALTSVFTSKNKLLWSDHTGEKPAQTPKLMANNKEGWIGWINPDSAVFVKQYPNIQTSEAAPGEEEVEYYYSSPSGYWELENTGKYTSIAPGDSSKWTVKWYLRKLPKDVDRSKGSYELSNFVRKTLKLPIDTDTIPPVNSQKLSQLENVTVSPNPANTFVKINGIEEPSNISFVDLAGKVVLTADLNIDNSDIDVNVLRDGIYFYNITSQKRNYSGKLMIKR